MISIVCATYNSEKTIVRFLDSIRNQTSQQFELIIVDGKSEDKTLKIIEENRDLVSRLISENDKGIYDAWNKGIQMASFNWVSFIGSDDRLMPEYVEIYQRTVLSLSSDSMIEYVSSKVRYVDKNEKVIKVMGQSFEWSQFKNQMTTAHVGSIHNIQLYNDVGLYNSDYKIIGDYELLLRKSSELKTEFIDEVTIEMMAGGASLSLKALIERYNVQKEVVKLKPLQLIKNLFLGYTGLIMLKLNPSFDI